jgi:hypothetical protein
MKHTKSIVWAIAVAAAVLVSVPSPVAYTLKATKWNSTQVPFYVNPQNSDVSESEALAAIQFGAYAWTNQTNAAFSFQYAGSTTGSSAVNNGKNEVFFRNVSNGTTIATTYTWSSGSRTVDTDIVFWDGGFTFHTGSSGCTGGMYIEDIAAHEFGHSVGLGHSTVSGATMLPTISYCSMEWRSLSEDDQQGVEYLYPSGVSNTPPVATILSPSPGSTTEGTVLTFSGSAMDGQDGDISAGLVWLSSLDGPIGTGRSFQKLLSVGSHTITAEVTDSHGATATVTEGLTVEPGQGTPSPGPISLSGRAYKVKGLQRADLQWTGTTITFVDVYRDGVRLATVGNTGRYTDAINKKGAGSYIYAVCETGTANCSNQARITF